MERQYPYIHAADMRVLVQSDYFSKTSKQHGELSMNISVTRAHDTGGGAGTNANNLKALICNWDEKRAAIKRGQHATLFQILAGTIRNGTLWFNMCGCVTVSPGCIQINKRELRLNWAFA